MAVRVQRPAEVAARDGQLPDPLSEDPAGLSLQEIATRLFLGYGTVRTHVSRLLTKLECRDRAQLVMYAYESGLAVRGR